MTELPEIAVVNAEGKVALRYMQQKPAYVTCNGNEYVFSVNRNISMTWVAEEDVECMLAIRDGCGCGGGNKKKNMIMYGDELHVGRWGGRVL